MNFPLLSLVLDVVYIPLYSIIILPLCFLVYVLILLIPQITGPFIDLLVFLITYANKLADFIHGLNVFNIVLGKLSLLMYIIFFICFIALFIILEKYWFQKKKLLLFLLLIPFILQVIYLKFSPIGEVTMIDVGQGDSILIKLPFNQGNYLIDTGGVIAFNTEEWRERRKSFDPGSDIVVPFVKKQRYYCS